MAVQESGEVDFFSWRSVTVAKKSSQGKENELWSKEKWKGFVNVRMTDQEKSYVKDNLLEEMDGLEFLMNAATDGYKCSISYSIPEDVFTVSLTGQYQQKPNAGITMSIRHRELIVALTALSFCSREDGKSVEWSDRYSLIGNDDW